MNCKAKLQTICDQLVAEIESGDYDAALLQFAGILDGAIATGADAARMRGFLLSHPIAGFLGLGKRSAGGLGNSTSKLLAHARMKIASEKAQLFRMEKSAAAMKEAWRRGANICSFDLPDPLFLEKMQGLDTGNIQFARYHDRDGKKAAGEFDVVIAASEADRMSAEELRRFLKFSKSRLREDGKLLLSFFTPQHAGLGWRLLLNPADAHCHDVQEICALAASEGFSVNSYFDPSGCAIWAVLHQHKQGG